MSLRSKSIIHELLSQFNGVEDILDVTLKTLKKYPDAETSGRAEIVSEFRRILEKTFERLVSEVEIQTEEPC